MVSDLSLPSPDFSVDRERYRKNPAEMLIGHPENGIAAFYVGDIPPSLTSEDGRQFDFGVEYRPLIDNRAHSEVHSYTDGARLSDEQRKPPRQIRKKFRDLLRQKIQILDFK